MGAASLLTILKAATVDSLILRLQNVKEDKDFIPHIISRTTCTYITHNSP